MLKWHVGVHIFHSYTNFIIFLAIRHIISFDG